MQRPGGDGPGESKTTMITVTKEQLGGATRRAGDAVTSLDDLRKEWLRKAAKGDCELWSVGRSVAEVRAEASRLTPDPEADESTRFYLEAARAEFERIASYAAAIDRARNAGGDGHSAADLRKDAEASVPTEPGEHTPTQLAYFEGGNAETVVAMGDALVNAGFRREDAAILWASGMGLDELKRRLATEPSGFALERGLLKLKRHVAASVMGLDERGLLKRHVAAGTGIAR